MPYHQAVGVDHPVLEMMVEYEEGFLEGGDSIPLVTIQCSDNGGEKAAVVDTAFADVPQPNPTVLETTVIVEVIHFLASRTIIIYIRGNNILSLSVIFVTCCRARSSYN